MMFAACRFLVPQPQWQLSSRPSELVGALEEHADWLIQQLGTDDVTSDLTGMGEDSVTVQLLFHCMNFAKTAARLAV